jgi:hypothetical protein
MIKLLLWAFSVVLDEMQIFKVLEAGSASVMRYKKDNLAVHWAH